MQGRIPTDFEWQAIATNDLQANKDFIYAVMTTKICCHPSCKSKLPNRENVRIYNNVAAALEGGFRPCKRCKPSGERLSDKDWTNQMNEYMDRHFNEHITLQVLAEAFHGSPFHLQRVYKNEQGFTPTEYLQKVRINEAITLLNESTLSIEEVGNKVGLHNTSYFITLFKKMMGTTPKQYKKTLEGR